MSPSIVDLTAVLTHEFGHVLGFEHPCRTGSGMAATEDDRGRLLGVCTKADSELPSVMFPGSTAAASPGAAIGTEDVRGLCAVYAKPSSQRASGCNCSLASPGTDRPFALVAAAPALLAFLLRRSRRSRSSWTLRYSTARRSDRTVACWGAGKTLQSDCSGSGNLIDHCGMAIAPPADFR
jgi:MYXO-CTERM domain-containing protein